MVCHDTSLKEEVWCCTRDEGRHLEASGQARASNPCKLLSYWLRVLILGAR